MIIWRNSSANALRSFLLEFYLSLLLFCIISFLDAFDLYKPPRVFNSDINETEHGDK